MITPKPPRSHRLGVRSSRDGGRPLRDHRRQGPRADPIRSRATPVESPELLGDRAAEHRRRPAPPGSGACDAWHHVRWKARQDMNIAGQAAALAQPRAALATPLRDLILAQMGDRASVIPTRRSWRAGTSNQPDCGPPWCGASSRPVSMAPWATVPAFTGRSSQPRLIDVSIRSPTCAAATSAG
jgi:hypothetical protein